MTKDKGITDRLEGYAKMNGASGSKKDNTNEPEPERGTG